jgi:hypothetical protein
MLAPPANRHHIPHLRHDRPSANSPWTQNQAMPVQEPSAIADPSFGPLEEDDVG